MGTLILGAGSSIDVFSSFKSGEQLLDSIVDLVTYGNDFFDQLNKDFGISASSLISFKENLIEYKLSYPRPSIDSFRFAIKNYPELASVRDDFDWISKIAIFYCILQWEHDFKLSIEAGKIEFQTSWIQKIIPYLISNQNLRSGTLNIVTFNYDRLIEYLLNLNGYNDNSTENLFWLRIIHVYGSVNIDTIPFGFIPSKLNELKPHIGDFNTIFDQQNIYRKKSANKWDMTRIELANEYISKSMKSYFLGFGFDQFNCRNLRLQEMNTDRFYGNIYSPDRSKIYKERLTETSRISSMLPNINFKYLTCSEFIDFVLEQ